MNLETINNDAYQIMCDMKFLNNEWMNEQLSLAPLFRVNPWKILNSLVT